MKTSLICFFACALIAANANSEEIKNNDWSGLYLGGSLGALNFENSYAVDNSTTTEGFNQSKTKGVYGLDIGYNTQYNNWIFGVELNYFSVFSDSYVSSVAQTYPDRTRASKIDNIFTLTPKVGYAFDNWMIYGKGGYARGNFKYLGWNTLVNEATGDAPKSLNGWVVGLGLDYKLFEHVNFGLEYDHIELDKSHIDINSSYSPFLSGYYNPAHLNDVNSSINALMMRINYQF